MWPRRVLYLSRFQYHAVSLKDRLRVALGDTESRRRHCWLHQPHALVNQPLLRLHQLGCDALGLLRSSILAQLYCTWQKQFMPAAADSESMRGFVLKTLRIHRSLPLTERQQSTRCEPDWMGHGHGHCDVICSGTWPKLSAMALAIGLAVTLAIALPWLLPWAPWPAQ